MNDLLKDVSYKADPDWAHRSQERRQVKIIKVVFGTDLKKQGLFGNLKSLKGMEKYQSVSISDDYTIAERPVLRSWGKKAQEKNEQEPKDSNITWRVKGNPKSGLIF